MGAQNAIKAGYNALQILGLFASNNPKLANGIAKAQSAGYSASQILKYVDQGNKSDPNDDNAYLTDREQTLKIQQKNRRKEAMQAVGLLGTAGAVAAGGYALYNQNRAVQPTQILPAQIQPNIPRPGHTINVAPVGNPQLPAPRGQLPNRPRQGGLPYNPQSPKGGAPTRPRGPSQPNAPAPTQPNKPLITPYTHDEKKNIKLVKSLGEDKKLNTILQSGLEMQAMMEVAKENLPKLTLSVLSKAPGGLEQALKDYQKHLLQTDSETKRVKALSGFQNQLNPSSMMNQEMQRFQDQYGEEEAPEFENAPMIQEEEPSEEPQQEEILNPIEEELPAQSIQERIKRAAFGQEEPSKISETKPLDRRGLYVPNFHHKDEPLEEYVKRKKVGDAINKAAHLIYDGKSFLDLPMQKGVGYSTAADVLRFVGGVPNVYDALLEDDEKDELFEALNMPEGLEPTEGERNVYGATLRPNMVWNLLLNIEPGIKDLAPPSIKGSKGKPKGGKMGTTEMRRFLTHAVYGALSGKTISYELADKIKKISNATSHLDQIVKAAHHGNTRKMDEEMESLMDDDYFMQTMSDEAIELKINKMKTPERLEKESELEKEDAKGAASIKAAATRRKKNEIKEPEKKVNIPISSKKENEKDISETMPKKEVKDFSLKRRMHEPTEHYGDTYDNIFAIWKDEDNWNVSHIPTGATFGSFPRRKQAESFLKGMYDENVFDKKKINSSDFDTVSMSLDRSKAHELRSRIDRENRRSPT